MVNSQQDVLPQNIDKDQSANFILQKNKKTKKKKQQNEDVQVTSALAMV